MHLDFVIEALTDYTPHDNSLNGFNGRFARISVASGTLVDLRLTVYESCALQSSCQACEDSTLTASQKAACYAAGCACFADVVTAEADCTPGTTIYNNRRASYFCAEYDTRLVLPTLALVAFAAFDLDGGPSGGCLEQVEMLGTYAYMQKPLVPSSGNSVASQVQGSGPTFTSPSDGVAAVDPSDPTVLTDDQASRDPILPAASGRLL